MLSLNKSLFSLAPHVTIVSALSIDDFIITDLPQEDFHPKSKSIKSKGVALVLKESSVNAIIEAFSGDDEKPPKVCSLDSTMIEFPMIHSTFFSYVTLKVTKDVSYRGLRTTAAKVARFEELQNAANQEFADKKATLIDDAIIKLNKSLSDIVDTNNDKFADLVKSCVVDLKVNDGIIDSVLTDKEKAMISKNDAQTAALNKQIDELNKSKKALADEAYRIKRTSLVNAIKESHDETVNAVIDSFADTEKTRPNSSLFNTYLIPT